jgi:hypothetical protein
VTILTALILVAVLLALWDIEEKIRRQHQELMGLLNDLATMVGEWLEEQER